jgi:hypothetical protein
MLRIKFLIVPAVVGLALVMAPTNPVLAKGEKITICHMDRETGETETIRIGVGAQAAHDNHGDDTTKACPGPKVEICHAPLGNPDMKFTILVNEDEVAQHEAHGDDLVACS